jgi:hypothetical protein
LGLPEFNTHLEDVVCKLIWFWQVVYWLNAKLRRKGLGSFAYFFSNKKLGRVAQKKLGGE